MLQIGGIYPIITIIMIRQEFENGLPHSRLENGDSLDALQTRYGNFAHGVVKEVKGMDPSAPDDILTFGDNWYQLVETRGYPNSDIERILQQQGATGFANIWPIRGRRSEDNIHVLMGALQKGVRAGSLDDRIMDRLAVLDLTTVNPPVKEQDLTQRTDTPWGVNGVLKGANTLIYHITSGFSRQNVKDVEGKPEDGVSSSIFWGGQMKLD